LKLLKRENLIIICCHTKLQKDTKETSTQLFRYNVLKPFIILNNTSQKLAIYSCLKDQRSVHEIRDWVGLEIMHLLLIIKNKQQEIGVLRNIL
jgi:hypothetical protein